MEVQTFFLYLLGILLTARIFAELAVRLRAPSANCSLAWYSDPVCWVG